MDKQSLVDRLIHQLEVEKESLVEAARNSIDAATNEESEPEDQYDTRGVEASYLASAQTRRVADVEETISLLRHTSLRDFDESDPISATALVELEQNGKSSICFLLPRGGGTAVDLDGRHVNVVTPRSPLGEALIGRTVGDVAAVDTGRDSKEYEIISVR